MLIDLNYPIRIAWPKENAIMISGAKKMKTNKQFLLKATCWMVTIG